MDDENKVPVEVEEVEDVEEVTVPAEKEPEPEAE